MEGECTKNSQVGLSNVSTRLSPILVINRGDVDKTVQYTTLLPYGGKREISAHNTIICWSGIVLNFLDEHNVWSVQILGDVISDGRDVGGVRCHILDLVDINEWCTV